MNKLLNKVFSFPGSILLVPLFLSAFFNTYFHNHIYIGEPVNSILNGNGTMTLLFIMIFISGLMLDINQIKNLIKEVTILIVFRIILIIILYYLIVSMFDIDGVFGIYSFTLLIALCSSNPGLYMSLVSKYGNKDNMSLFGPLNILPLPFLPLTIYSLSSGTTIDYNSIMAIFIPFLAGIIIRIILPDISKKAGNITPFILFFWGFGIGSSINLNNIGNEFLSGLILTVLYYLLMTVPLFFIERKTLNTDGILSVSSTSIAAIAIVIPEMLNITLNDQVINSSINQLTVAFILTSFITPFIVKFMFRKDYQY